MRTWALCKTARLQVLSDALIIRLVMATAQELPFWKETL